MNRARQAAIIGAAVLLTAAPGGPAGADAARSEPCDTCAAFDWGWVYNSVTSLARNSDPFPWNDPLDSVHVAGRVAALVSWRARGGISLFLKGAGGAAGETHASARGGFALEQGHVALESARFSARLFSRERVFRTSGRLLPLVSNDSPLVSGGGEGLALSAALAAPLRVSYTGAVLEKRRTAAGLPAPGGGGTHLNLVSIDFETERWHAGLVLADTRAQDHGDAVLIGLGCGIPVGGAVCIAEYARSAAGTWSDLGRERLFGFETRRMKPGSISRGVSPDAALKVEVLGLEIAGARLGRIGLVPGYRHAGGRLINRQGEIPPGVVESYVVCWWRHPTLAAMLTAEAADRCVAATGESGGMLTAALNVRLRGGLQTREALLFRAGRRPTLVCSVLDENSLTRVSATARIDDAGEANRLSYLAEGAVNLGRGLTLGGTLLLASSANGFYSVDLEMRGGKNFFARASFGSYVPHSEYVMLNHGPEAPTIEGSRFVSLQTRFAFGGI